MPENHPKRSSAGLCEVKDSNVLLKQGASFDSEMSKIHFKTSERSEQYNLSSKQEKALNGSNFITLGRIPEQERIEIIQRGFQLQAEGKISLKKYYEGTQTDSLLQLKGYNIKYESIRRTKLYQNLKE